MAAFPSKKFRSANPANNSLASRYRAMMAKRPFLLFGLPFMSVIVAGSFVLTPATAIRYEKHDRKVRQMTRDEELGVRSKNGRRVDIKDEYYVSFFPPGFSEAFRCGFWEGRGSIFVQSRWRPEEKSEEVFADSL